MCVPKNSKIRHLRKKLISLEDEISLENYRFLLPVFPPDLGVYPRLDRSKTLLQRYH